MRAVVTYQSGKVRTSNLMLAGLHSPGTYLLESMVTIAVATCPLLICAWVAQGSGRWELFERSGSITTAIDLLLASRRYIRYGALELAVSGAHNDRDSNLGEVLEEILRAKLGLVLSAFGTLVWGWGAYLGWWSFSYLALWAVFAILRTRRDFLGTRDYEVAQEVQTEGPRQPASAFLDRFAKILGRSQSAADSKRSRERTHGRLPRDTH